MLERRWFTPATESLLAKRTQLESQLEDLEATLHADADKRVLQRCQTNLETVKDLLDKRWRPHHPHLTWQLMHRIDEDLLLILPRPELLANAANVLAYFDMNITEAKLRRDWLGEGARKGSIQQAIDDLHEKDKEERARHVLRQALNISNAQMDRSFWVLSMNTLTSVISGVALGVAMLVFWRLGYPSRVSSLGTADLACSEYSQLALLGLMGGYLSNVLTREGLLYVRGGPFWRYALLHLVSRPVLSAFGAVLIAVLVKSEMVVAIKTAAANKAGLVALTIADGAVGYAYAVIALASGFASDKVLSDMIGRVLKRLEQKAEKTKESKPDKANP